MLIKIFSILTAPLVLSACGSGPGMGFDEPRPSAFSSIGERIYYTATSPSGTPITPVGGTMHVQMHATACADCHGNGRQGQRMMPRFWLEAPPLTTAALLGETDDGHGDHAAYDRGTLARAITFGVDAAGEPLDNAMPRWQMSASDLAELVDYLLGPQRDHPPSSEH